MQMHIAARRCCIAFAAYCCPRPTECSQLIGEQKCGPADDELVALLSDMEDYGATAAAKEKSAATTVKTETFTLEVSGMDCPDCLAKVRKAFESLPGATIKKIDFIRGIVEVERDESKSPQLTRVTLTCSCGGCRDHRTVRCSCKRLHYPRGVLVAVGRAALGPARAI